jgi:Cysteine rich repeat
VNDHRNSQRRPARRRIPERRAYQPRDQDNTSWCGRRPFSSPGERRSCAAARAATEKREVKVFRKLFVIALFITAFVSVVAAQDRKGLRAACMGSAKKFCADVQRGGGRILKCLRDHAGDLTPACRDALAGPKAQ